MNDVDLIKSLDIMLKRSNFFVDTSNKKRKYTLKYSTIGRFVVTFCMWFSNKHYYLEGDVSINGESQYPSNFESSAKSFAEDAWKLATKLIDYHQMKMVKFVYAQQQKIQDPLVDTVHDALLTDDTLPYKYKAECINCHRAIEGGFNSTFLITSDNQSYFLCVNTYSRVAIGDYRGKK